MSEVKTSPTVTLTGVGLPGDETAQNNEGQETTQPAATWQTWLTQNWLIILAVIAFGLAGWLWIRNLNNRPRWPGQ